MSIPNDDFLAEAASITAPKVAQGILEIDLTVVKLAHNPAQMIGAQVIAFLKDFDFGQEFDQIAIGISVR